MFLCNLKNTVLDHISLFHRWGVKRIQYEQSWGVFPEDIFLIGKTDIFTKRENFQRNQEAIDTINKLFSKEHLLANMHIKVSHKRKPEQKRSAIAPFFTTYINIRPWQDFFFNLMPWRYRNPDLYAGATFTAGSILAGLGVWYAMKKKH